MACCTASWTSRLKETHRKNRPNAPRPTRRTCSRALTRKTSASYNRVRSPPMLLNEPLPPAGSQQRERIPLVHRCRHVLAALSPAGDNGGLIRYAANLARVGVGVEFRFVSVLSAQPDAAHVIDRDRLLAALEGEVAEAFTPASEV